MNKRFKYDHFDQRTHYVTASVITAGVMLLLLWFYYIETSYYTAWIISNIVAIICLYILSVPRYIEVTSEAVEIHCIVDLTRIKLEDLSSVRKMAPKEMSRCIPIVGSYGFFGYYGYYLDLRRWNMVKVYATQWRNFVEIEDIYEQRYIISCVDYEALARAVEENAAGATAI